MPLPTGTILGILADNLRKRGSILPLPSRALTAWAKGLDIPVGGRTIIYTGHMYQLMPSLLALGKLTARFENSSITRLSGIGRAANKIADFSMLTPLMVSSKDEAEFNELLRKIALLLRAADVDFGYLYDEELYLGTLAYDEGIMAAFKEHALKVHQLFKKHNVKRVITVDPHTTNMLRSVFPSTVEDFNLQVQSYIEVLAERKLSTLRKLDADVVVHDSCVYARYEDMVEQPRDLLRKAGAGLPDLEYSGRNTFCCGGPVETLFPSEAHRIAKQRVEQLTAVGDRIVTMCPICLVNLRQAASGSSANVSDISQFLCETYCPF